MNAWRLLKLETHDAYGNMAIDEAILTARIDNLVPNTVRLYRWNPSAVSIGRFQNVQNEAQLESCRRLGVDIVRRITGGGTVFHDSQGEITYSVVARKEDLKTEDITAIYARIYSGLAEALRVLGLEADFSEGDLKNCPNLTVKGRKVSGSSQAHKKGVVLQHGTLLLDVDLERMFTLLRVPWATTCMEVVGAAKRRITSLSQELGKSVSIEEANRALIDGFQKALNARLVADELTPYESQLAEKLSREKYSTEEWNIRGKAP
jgi:lipoate-protein ligase A